MIPMKPLTSSVSAIVLACAVHAGSPDETRSDRLVHDPWATFADEAAERFGDIGKRAAAFLAEHRPQHDSAIDRELLIENLTHALQARETFTWAAQVDEDMFFNDVLPYAVIDEPRDHWRPKMFELASDIVADASTAAEAAQSLNRKLFQRTEVRYSTNRKRANQNVNESIELGKASCTGLSIMLVNACRAVGIPARIAGIASWPDRGGNHAWAEIWDGERWRFTGAAEYDANGLDRAWFDNRAAGAIEGDTRHGVWATSWRKTGHHYPLAWSPQDRSVPAVEVTHRYRRATKDESDRDPIVSVRLWDSRGGSRVAAHVRMIDTRGGTIAETQTFADPDDINRVAEFPFAANVEHRFEVSAVDEMRLAWIEPREEPDGVLEMYWDQLSLSKQSASDHLFHEWDERASAIRAIAMDELEHSLVVRAGEHALRLKWNRFGQAEPDKRPSLWISMHGGGGAPTEVNDRQWRNQLSLYEPEEGYYVAPRAPSDSWNMWHRAETDRLFDRLIETAIAVWGVDPDRVYLMGYSAGGDGVYQLAPRMADRFAAAAMMAGHPNDATPHGLRNLPFAIFIGEEDAAYNRNDVAKQWGQKLARLQEGDPNGYPHRVTIYPDLGHWMEGRDAEALPWMIHFTRDPWPARIVWRQGNVPHERLYWLAVADADDAKRGRTITASIDGQRITLDSEDLSRITLLLSDDLLDLDQPVEVVANGEMVFSGRVRREQQAIRRSLELRADPRAAATAIITVTW